MLRFLDVIEGETERLFIVGDFFDFWLCRDNYLYPPFRPVVEKLIALVKGGMTVALFEGNHDFYLGDFFEPLGFQVYPEEAVVDIDGKRLYISHGDTVDYTNTAYLSLRKFLRSRPACMIHRFFYPPLLWRFARFCSSMSKNHLAKSSDRLPEMMRAFALERFREGADAVILGHGHMPIKRDEGSGDSKKTLCVLGDWIHHYSYLTMTEGQFSLHYFDR